MKITQTKSTILDAKPVEEGFIVGKHDDPMMYCLLYTSPSPRDRG